MKQKQYTSTILMVEPTAFYYNPETAVNNYFQTETTDSQEDIQKEALEEFQGMVSALRSKGVNVITIKDTASPHTPDSIFPNNWISFHDNGNVVLYPMFAKNRREERREEDVLSLLEEKGFHIDDVIDFTSAEEDEIFLEGTGSIILDREHELAYACISQRTDEDLLIEFCEELEYTPVIFQANQTVNGERKPIYHTNVMMCIADKYTIICLDSIDDKKEKKAVCEYLLEAGKEIIAITEEQMHQFAGNMLQVGGLGQSYLVMSQTAYNSLNQEQISKIEAYNPILPVKIDLIEKLGGGSARCMMAEVFLPKK
ncbi:amidinotransferase [Empedobacter falsenii]|uniref:citrulline utilization hydrolase CtlX n=1 Tax=Empedobacter falsenii TaxID=343874 RepID=UPI002576F774|nr:arginine deiminase-related protein [Empedobacter falsenii]MDM1298236.1 amidinotransferase [Empedobacter falsenii]MDM1318207.1 amidinotransferase [Empedobacter falsenii]